MSATRADQDRELEHEERLRALEAAGVDHDPVTGEALSIRQMVLRDAERLVTGARADEYGPPAASLQRIAEGWTWWLCARGRQVHIAAEDVAGMLALLKLARASQTPSHADSWVDLAGYAAIGAEVAGAKPGA
jgi:hypothetical protein